MTKRKNAKAPSTPPASADTPTFTALSKLSALRVGDEVETEDGQRFVYTADLRGSRWGREVYTHPRRNADGTASLKRCGELQELPDVPYRLIRSPNSERQEQKEVVVDPMTVTRR